MAYDAFFYAHETEPGEVIALAGSDQLSIRTAQQRGTGPKAWLPIGWCLLKGSKLRADFGEDLRGVTQSSEVVVHSIVNSSGVIVKWRYILLESTENGSVMDRDNNVWRSVPPGYYCDANVDGNGNVTSTTTPAAFDPNDPPADSEEVMEAVSEARASEGV